MTTLDQPGVYEWYDPSHLRDRIAALPDQCQQAWEEGSAFHPPKAYAGAQAVVVVGMGGSAIGGDLLSGLADMEQAPPVHVVRDYTLPSWVGPKTLVIVSSYSGNTEEALAGYRQAREQRALLMALTGGGILAQQATEEGTPLFTITYQGEPRSAVGYSFIVPLALVCKLGLLADKSGPLQESIDILEEQVAAFSPQVPEARNPAKELASAMHGKLPVVYGASFLTGVARRWKTQLNENSKVWSFYEPLPELNHNAVLGYSLPVEIRERLYVALLYSRFLYPRTSLRYRITQELLKREGVAHRQLEGIGGSPLAQLLSTLLLGDYVSYYLGILNELDPAPVPVIEYLKERLAEG